jgi:hypothetical protein
VTGDAGPEGEAADPPAEAQAAAEGEAPAQGEAAAEGEASTDAGRPVTQDANADLREALTAAISLVGLLAYVYLIGWLVSTVRYTAARLPGDVVTSVLSNAQLFGAGLRTSALAAVAFAVLSGLAWLVAGRRWGARGPEWQQIVAAKGVVAAKRVAAAKGTDGAAIASPQASRDWVVRVVAGYNMVVIAAVVGLLAARVVEWLFSSAWWLIIGAWVVGFLLASQSLARRSWLQRSLGVHVLLWMFVALAAVFVSAPLGLLLLAGIAVATVGRQLARQDPQHSVAGLLRSPLPWALLSVYALVGLAYYATPPVSFQRVVLDTTAGPQAGGYLQRTADGLYIVTCSATPAGPSTGEHVVLVPPAAIRSTTIGGREVSLDSGERPSLLDLGLSALGIDARPPVLLKADLRASRASCVDVAGLHLTRGSEDAALGPGTIVGPGPVNGQANDGEPPIRPPQTPTAVAALALKYQPTVESTVADRFWPVSVGAVLHDTGYYGGGQTCLMPAGATQCRPVTSLAQFKPGVGQSGDYLRYPAALQGDPTNQFQAFESGQGIHPGSATQWLDDPGRLDPWSTAQVYFYYAGVLGVRQWQDAHLPAGAPAGLIGLEYWFFYPFNYYPTVVGSQVMNDAPLAADKLNTDLHQGDWEHVTVLLSPGSLTPRWIYMARHDGEGQFYRWDSQALQFDHGHPIVQAAFGGHPTYDNNCGGRPRPKIGDALDDWVVCGSSRFAFSAATTPLVDIAHTTWACWKGHFGETKPGLEVAAQEEDPAVATGRAFIYVQGPPSPLRQGENTGACTKLTPAAAESRAKLDGVR